MYNSSISNMLNGVSQQPPTVRLPSQCSILENGYPSATSSLSKRPPTQVISNFGNAVTPHGKLHIIDRGDGEVYAITLSKNGISAYDLKNNASVPVTASSQNLAYLTPGSEDSFVKDITLTTVADFTFVCNRNVTVTASDTDGSLFNRAEGLIWIKTGNYGTKYAVEITLRNSNGDVVSNTTPMTASYTTGASGSVGTGYISANDTVDGETFLAGTAVLDTSYIAANLVEALETAQAAKVGSEGTVWNKIFFVRQGYAISVRVDLSGANPPVTDFDLLHQNGVPSADGTQFVKDSVQSFEQLPILARDGMLVKIEGLPEEDIDDYFVRFVADSPDTSTEMSSGLWSESRPYHIVSTLTPSTMPHALIRYFDNSNNPYFVFTQIDGSADANNQGWSTRLVGTDSTNPVPSFVGQSISSIFGFKNRLGITAGEAVILSEAGVYFNFWRTTVADLLDTDPIDIYSSHTAVTKFRYGIPLDDKLVLFSDSSQMALSSGGDLLTPKTVELAPLSQYECEADCMPSVAGSELFFGFARSSHTGIRDMVVNQDDSALTMAPEITSHVPAYIRGYPIEIKASSLERAVVVLASDSKSVLYLYKWLDVSNERVQSSWSSWVFSGVDILSLGWLDSAIYMLVWDHFTNKLGLRKVDVQEGLVDPDSPIVSLLDDRVTVAKNSVSSGTFTVSGQVASSTTAPAGQLSYASGTASFTNTDPEMASGSFVVNPGSTASVHSAAITGTYAATHASGDYNTRELTVFPVVLGSNCSLAVTVLSNPTASANIFTPTSWPSLVNNSLICEIVVDGSTVFYEELFNSPDFSVTASPTPGVRNVEGQASFNYGSDSYVVACDLNFNDGTTALASDVITGNMLLSSGTNQANRTVVLKLIRKRVMNADGTILQGSGTPLFSFASSYVNAGENPVNIAGGSLIPLVDLVYADGVLAGQSIPFDFSYDPALDQSTFSFDPAIGSPKMFYGKPYRLMYRFSPLYLRTGQERTALTSGRYQIRNIQLVYSSSGPFFAKTSPVNELVGPSYSYNRGPTAGASFVNSSIESGSMRIPVMAKPDQIHIDLVNDTPFPSYFVSAEVEATYDGRFRRI